MRLLALDASAVALASLLAASSAVPPDRHAPAGRQALPRVRVMEATVTEPALGHRLGFTQVRLSRPSARRVVVTLATRSGTATAGLDFVPLHPTVVFAPGETRQLVSVELLSDNRDEPAETLRLAVTSVRHATANRGATITVLDEPGG